MKSIYSVCDIEKKVCFKQFTNNEIYGPNNKAGLKAQKMQGQLCKVLSIPNNGMRIGVHMNAFNDIPKKKVWY